MSQFPPPQGKSKPRPLAPGIWRPWTGQGGAEPVELLGRNRLNQALELEQKPDQRYLRLVVYGMGAALLVFLPWAALTPVNEVVVASGEVVPEGSVQVIQHLEGGIVERVAVQEGDQVQRGQLILQLRPNLVDSEVQAMEQKLQALTLQQAQLRAAIGGPLRLPASRQALGPLGSRVQQAQQTLAYDRRANSRDQIDTLEAQISQKRAEIARFDDQEQHYKKEQTLLAQGVAMYEKLDDQGAVSRLQVINAERELASSNTHLAELQGNRSVAQGLLNEAQAKLRSLRSGLRLEDSTKIADLVNEEAIVTEDIKRLRNQLERTRIVAPVDGIVQDVRYKNSSAVVAPGATVAEVVPSSSRRLVEARVRPADIGFVRPGLKAKVKLQPYDFSLYGSIPGTVKSISPTTIQNPDDRQYYYRIKIALDRQFVDRGKQRYPILPGMTLTADIQGPRRSVLRYLLQPLTRTMDSAFHEAR